MSVPLRYSEELFRLSAISEMSPLYCFRRFRYITRPHVYSSKRVLLAAAAALSMTPFALHASTLSFSAGSYTGSEGSGGVPITVNMNTAAYGGCTIAGEVVATGGSATSGSDYSNPAALFLSIYFLPAGRTPIVRQCLSILWTTQLSKVLKR